MTLALTLLCRVVRRRVRQGEDLEKILEDYPRLTEEALATVRKALNT